MNDLTEHQGHILRLSHHLRFRLRSRARHPRQVYILYYC